MLLICIDALRADRLGVYGASPSPSPSLDAFARDAVVFDNATSVASWTKPSVPSLLSGLYPREHGVFDNSGGRADVLAAAVVPLAETLQRSGWQTAAFVENDQLERGMSGLDRGFDLYFDKAGRAPEIVDRFLSWSGMQQKRPWFAYLHILDPHFPYAPDDFTFEDTDASRLRMRVVQWDFRGDQWWLLRERVNEGSMQLEEEARRDLDLLYRLEIAAVDAAVGRMFRLLGEGGLLDRTLVFVTADHGEGFLEHGRIDHGYGPYQELLHVPLLMRMPRAAHAGTRTSALVQNVDIAPTVLAALGIAPSQRVSSVSLLPLADGTQREVRSHAVAEERHGHWSLVGIRDRDYSYVRSQGAVIEDRTRFKMPASAAPGTRLRARGIFDGSRFIAGTVRRLEPGDTDTEIQGPLEAFDPVSRTARLLGHEVFFAEETAAKHRGDAAALSVASLQSGQTVRVHGTRRDTVFVPTRTEDARDKPIEIEGVIRAVEIRRNGDLRIDLGDTSVVVDPAATWNDFSGLEESVDSADAPANDVVVEKVFDRRVDPAEQHDISRSRPAELVRMRAMADRALESLRPASSQDVGSTPLDESSRQRLRALGYVE